MLRFIKQFHNMDILSLQTGLKVGVLGDPIINPSNLRIVAFECTSRIDKKQLVVFIDDIRETGRRDIIVDSQDSMMPMDDLVRLKELREINFQLPGKKVATEKKSTLGKVSDYTVDDQSYFIMKIYVRPTLTKSFISSNMIIDRQQIIEVTDKAIIVKDGSISETEARTRTTMEPAA